MLGLNEPRQRETGDLLQWREVFYSIQGEGPFMGCPAVFIRLTGCNLRCWFCDTKWNDEQDARESAAQLAKRARDAGPNASLVVITGGEPCRQDLAALFCSLYVLGFTTIQVETAGSFWQDCLAWPGVVVVVSPKISKVRKEFYEINAHWKYVVTGPLGIDGLPSEPTQRGGRAPARPPPGAPVYLQPCDEPQCPERQEQNIKEMVASALKHGYRAGLQMHKLMKVE